MCNVMIASPVLVQVVKESSFEAVAPAAENNIGSYFWDALDFIVGMGETALQTNYMD
jgi:hypothetical protein